MNAMTKTAAVAAGSVVRVLALPLSRRPQLTYYHVIQPPLPPSSAPPTLLQRALTRATDVWDKMGEQPDRHWQRRIYNYGEKLMDRIEYEELALKTVDPKRAAPGGAVLLHPTAPLQDAIEPAALWAAHLQDRIVRHRRGAYTWAAISPITFPFTIIPIIPNFPFFFCAWRVWSHWQAFSAAQYLASLPLRSEVSPELDAIYSSEDLSSGEELTAEHVKNVVTTFSLPPHSASEILRAVEQAHARRAALDQR